MLTWCYISSQTGLYRLLGQLARNSLGIGVHSAFAQSSRSRKLAVASSSRNSDISVELIIAGLTAQLLEVFHCPGFRIFFYDSSFSKALRVRTCSQTDRCTSSSNQVKLHTSTTRMARSNLGSGFYGCSQIIWLWYEASLSWIHWAHHSDFGFLCLKDAFFFALSSSKHLSLFLQEDAWKQEPRERDPDGRPRPQGRPARAVFNLEAAFSAASRAKDECVILTIRMPRSDIECHTCIK